MKMKRIKFNNGFNNHILICDESSGEVALLQLVRPARPSLSDMINDMLGEAETISTEELPLEGAESRAAGTDEEDEAPDEVGSEAVEQPGRLLSRARHAKPSRFRVMLLK